MSASFSLSELIFIFKTVASPWLCEAGPRQSQPFRRGLGRKIMKYRQNGKKMRMKYHQPTCQKVLIIGQNVVVTIMPPPFWHRTVQNGKGNSSMSQLEPLLGRCANNQNGTLRWYLPLGVRPPPLTGTNFQTFFYPTFFLLQLNPTYMKRILHIKISLLSPLIIGSKLTFISSSGR